MSNKTKINELLTEVCEQYVLQAHLWERTYGKLSGENPDTTEGSGRYWDEDEPTAIGPNNEREEYSVAALHYKRISQATVNLFNRAAPKLAELGYPTYKVTISGTAGGDVDHYDMDELVKEKFGLRATTDSESSCFYCFCSPEDADEILAYVQEIGGQNAGLQWETYSGDVGTANFRAREDDEWQIAGIGNWQMAQNMLEELATA